MRLAEAPEERRRVPTVAHALRHSPGHMARYRLASRYVVDKRVCDIACGAGYGTYFLSRCARKAVGVDVSQEAIDWATGHFAGPNLEYVRAAGDAPWPFRDSFDVVVSLETMEHVAAPELFLRNIYAHLSVGGTLVLSIPNGPRDQAKRLNPFHVHFFTQARLESLLEPLFAPVHYFSQVYRKDGRHYVARPFRTLLRQDPHLVDNYAFTPGLQPDAKTWVAIAVKAGEGR